MGLLSRALEGSQRGEQRDHEAKKVNAASARTIICRTVTGGAGMKVGGGLRWPCHHLAHPHPHPRYSHCARQQQHDKVKTFPPHLPIRRQAARDGVSQERRKNVGEMAGEARFSREMAAARGLNGDPAQARRDSPDPGRRHDGRGHLAAIFRRRAGRAAATSARPPVSTSSTRS